MVSLISPNKFCMQHIQFIFILHLGLVGLKCKLEVEKNEPIIKKTAIKNYKWAAQN